MQVDSKLLLIPYVKNKTLHVTATMIHELNMYASTVPSSPTKHVILSNFPEHEELRTSSD
jgi:hypothetical protein